MIRTLRVITAAFLFAGCTDRASASASEADAAFSFVVIGDTPYAGEDVEMLAKALPLVKDGAYPFIIHVGDYKGGRAPCTSGHDDRQAELSAALTPTPVFYTPGDSEWTDCDRNIDSATGKPYRVSAMPSSPIAAPCTTLQSKPASRCW